MAAPMFANAIATGPPCKGCATAGRRIVFTHRRGLVRTEVLATPGGTWTACPICDQAPADAPAWRHV